MEIVEKGLLDLKRPKHAIFRSFLGSKIGTIPLGVGQNLMYQLLAKDWCIEFWLPLQEMVPNFKLKNDLKKGSLNALMNE